MSECAAALAAGRHRVGRWRGLAKAGPLACGQTIAREKCVSFHEVARASRSRPPDRQPAEPGSPRVNQPSPNFAFLAHHDARLSALGSQAEGYFATDPNVTLFKLRQLCEILAKRAAANVGLLSDARCELRFVIDALFERGVIGATQRTLFHQLRRVGNSAVHEVAGTSSEALHHLKIAHQLGVWFQRSFGNDRKFDPGPFVPPTPPRDASSALAKELEQLRAHLAAHEAEAERAREQVEALRRAAEEELTRRLGAEARAQKAAEEQAIWEELAAQQAATTEAKTREIAALAQRLATELPNVQRAAAEVPVARLSELVLRAKEASEAIVLDEAATRRIVDAQLREAGWEADSEVIRYTHGSRPTKGRSLAIAEWPTRHGPADYALCVGLVVVGMVEAKKKHRDVSQVIPQAKRYSAGYTKKGDELVPDGSPWGECAIPFVFATNGRAFLRQYLDKSGVHFLDARKSTNHPRALEAWYSPEGLLALLEQDAGKADASLRAEAIPFIDRDYQIAAIRAAESAIADGRRELLLAMATGTGKTLTCAGLCYRLLKTNRFRRVLFLVDRSALGEQTLEALRGMRPESLQPFTDIFGVKALDDVTPDKETRLHIATVQAMVRRVIGPHEDDAAVPTVDTYDCIVVDECHRGYLLDRDLSDREMLFRDEDDYISKYRRVLDHFDAVKIGLTATPALHTTEIFGAPVFQYSYREAVVDGWLVDHEPPLRIVTSLSKDGIHYDAHEEVTVLDRSTQEVSKAALPDAVSFEVDDFHRTVITESWNRVVLHEVFRHVDPEQGEKTLIFCVNDEHADLVVRLAKEVLTELYGGVDDDAVLKITGTTDKPLEAIRRYRSDTHPSVAVTVDLLTTGVDIPKICNLVFLRRVRSRILYEQMLGRATRLSKDIGKERFRIFDAVGLYDALKDVTDMKPVVVDPKVTFEQLVHEIVHADGDSDRDVALAELLAKLHRKKRAFEGDGGEAFEAAVGMGLHEVLALLKRGEPAEVTGFLSGHPSFAPLLDRVGSGYGRKVVVSDRHDVLEETTRGYGRHGSRPPEDSLEAFRSFVATKMNEVPALLAVTQRPRDLKREDLRKLKLLLDEHGFGEAAVQTAFREQRNEDVAATIVGYIRRLALGSPLVPYAERVDRAVARMRAAHKFTEPQIGWLKKIAAQAKVELVVDREALDREAFKRHGGFARADLVFEGRLEALLGELLDEVWNDAG